jgi:GntR family transcriptional regulator
MTGYRGVADNLRAAIVRGDYPPGTTIPKETELMDRYGLGRNAIRRAITVLRAEGLVTPIRRRGTVVRDRTSVRLPVDRYADVLAPGPGGGPWETACAQQGKPGKTELVAASIERANADLAETLKIPEGSEVVHRVQHMYLDGQVRQIQHTWMPLDIAKGTPLAGKDKVVGGLYRELVAAGHPPAEARETVTARMPTREEAETMTLDMGSPVLGIDRVTRGRDGRVLLVGHAVAVADRVALNYVQTYSVDV